MDKIISPKKEKSARIEEIKACIESGRDVFLTLNGVIRTHQQPQFLKAFKVISHMGEGSDNFKISGFINNPSGCEKPYRVFEKDQLIVGWDEITFADNQYWRFGKDWKSQDYSQNAVAERKIKDVLQILKQ